MLSINKGGLISETLAEIPKLDAKPVLRAFSLKGDRGQFWHPFLEMSAKVKYFLRLSHL